MKMTDGASVNWHSKPLKQRQQERLEAMEFEIEQIMDEIRPKQIRMNHLIMEAKKLREEMKRRK